MSRAREGPRGRVEVEVPTLFFDNFLQHVRRRAAWHILIHEYHAVGLLERLDNPAVNIEGQQCLHVDDLDLDANLAQLLGCIQDDAAARAVGDHGHIAAFAQHFGHTQRQAHLADVVGQAFLDAIAVEHLDHDGGLVRFEQRVIEARGAGHVAWDEYVHAAHQMKDACHRRARVPDALQPMSARAHDDRRLLSACGTPAQGGQVVAHDLQRVQHIIEILNFRDRAQSAHGHADGLPEDGGFADARVGHAQRAVFFLHALEALVDVAEESHILTEADHARVAPEDGVEGGVDHLEAHHGGRVFRVDGRHFLDLERGPAIQMLVIPLEPDLVISIHPLDQHLLGWMSLGPQGPQRLVRRRMDVAPCERRQADQSVAQLAQGLRRRLGQAGSDLLEHVRDLGALLLHRGQVGIPGGLAESLHSGEFLFFNGDQLRVRGDGVIDDPAAHARHAVEFLFPFEAFGRFVTLVAARGGMSLRLGDVDDVHQGRDVIFARDVSGGGVGFEQGGIIPGVDGVKVVAAVAILVGAGVALEALQDGADVFLDHLELVGDRDAVAIVVDGEHGGSFEHADGIDRFPEQAFGGGGVADGGEGDFVAVVREILEVEQFGEVAVEDGGVRQADGARHLRGSGGDVGGDVVHLGLVAPGTVRVEVARGKVGVHRAAACGGIVGQVRVGVELGKKFLDAHHACHEHPGLVTIIARAPVTLAEGAGNGQVGQFLAVAENAEFCLATQDFTSTNQGRLPALIGQAVIAEDLFFRKGKLDTNITLLFGHVSLLN